MADEADRPGGPLYPPDAPPVGEPARRQAKVRELPASVLRPRDKLIRFGAGGVSQAELLAVMLGTGTKRRSVIRIAEEPVGARRAPGLPRLALDDSATERRVCRVQAAQMLV